MLILGLAHHHSDWPLIQLNLVVFSKTDHTSLSYSLDLQTLKIGGNIAILLVIDIHKYMYIGWTGLFLCFRIHVY